MRSKQFFDQLTSCGKPISMVFAIACSIGGLVANPAIGQLLPNLFRQSNEKSDSFLRNGTQLHFPPALMEQQLIYQENCPDGTCVLQSATRRVEGVRPVDSIVNPVGNLFQANIPHVGPINVFEAHTTPTNAFLIHATSAQADFWLNPLVGRTIKPCGPPMTPATLAPVPPALESWPTISKGIPAAFSVTPSPSLELLPSPGLNLQFPPPVPQLNFRTIIRTKEVAIRWPLRQESFEPLVRVPGLGQSRGGARIFSFRR